MILDRSGDPGACGRTRPTDAEAQGFVAQGAVLDDGHRVRLEPRVAAVDGDLDRGALAPASRDRISASRDGPRRRATPPSLLYSSLAMNADAGSGQLPVVHDVARRSRQLWRRVVGSAVVIAAVLVTAGCGIGQLKPAGAAADAFGSAVAAQQWASAAAMVCAGDQATVTPTALADRFSTPTITGYSLGGVQITDVNGHTTARAELVFHTASGIDSNVTMPLVDENKQWRPCP